MDEFLHLLMHISYVAIEVQIGFRLVVSVNSCGFINELVEECCIDAKCSGLYII